MTAKKEFYWSGQNWWTEMFLWNYLKKLKNVTKTQTPQTQSTGFEGEAESKVKEKQTFNILNIPDDEEDIQIKKTFLVHTARGKYSLYFSFILQPLAVWPNTATKL